MNFINKYSLFYTRVFIHNCFYFISILIKNSDAT